MLAFYMQIQMSVIKCPNFPKNLLSSSFWALAVHRISLPSSFALDTCGLLVHLVAFSGSSYNISALSSKLDKTQMSTLVSVSRPQAFHGHPVITSTHSFSFLNVAYRCFYCFTLRCFTRAWGKEELDKTLPLKAVLRACQLVA